MDKKCWECNEQEENLYWTNITNKHFFKALLGEFKHRLSIPPKFVSNFKEKLSETVVLRGPSGNKWTIGLNKAKKTFFFEHGWAKFVHDHCLQQTDFIVFRYAGDSIFDVLMFDVSFCEKESTYFVNKHGITPSANCECKGNEKEMESKGNRKDRINSLNKAKLDLDSRKLKENPWPDLTRCEENETKELTSGDDSIHSKLNQQSGTDVINRGNAGTYCSNKNTSSFNHECEVGENEMEWSKGRQKDIINSPKKANMDESQGEQKEGTKSVQCEGGDTIIQCGEDMGSSWSRSPRYELPSDADNSQYPLYFTSKRRPVTEAEKYRALEAAHAVESTDPSFIQIMKDIFVYNKFRMEIPFDWAKEHLPHNCHDIILCVSTRTRLWVTECNFKESVVELGKGWSDFVMDNNLEEGDACLFKLLEDEQRRKGIIVMNVSIFRVIKEVVSLTKFVGSPDSVRNEKRKRSGDTYIHSKTKAQLDINTVGTGTVSSRNALTSYGESPVYPYYFISNRRPVTEAEKDRALKLAHEVQFSKPGFIQVMQQCHVYKGPIMEIPIEWARKYLSRKSQDVFLRVFGNPINWICRLNCGENTATLERGWDTFVMDNNLEEGDVCLFGLCERETMSQNLLSMKVLIFRVIEQVIPLTRVIVPRP